MQRNTNQQDGIKPSLDQSLQGMKRISRPGRWVGGLVVHLVYIFVYAGMVHSTMGPVEIGIVNNNCQQNGHQEIDPSKLIDLMVDHGKTGTFPQNNTKTYQGKNNHGAQ